MGKSFYQHFAVIQDLSSPFILGMDFMKGASVTIHVPSRTVLMGDDIPCPDELDDDSQEGTHPLGGAMTLLGAPVPALPEEVELATLERNERAELLKLLSTYGDL